MNEITKYVKPKRARESATLWISNLVPAAVIAVAALESIAKVDIVEEHPWMALVITGAIVPALITFLRIFRTNQPIKRPFKKV